MKKTFSKDWTAEERLMLVIMLTNMIRDDIQKCGGPGGCAYGRIPGRPNIQSVHEMIVATPAELETYRDDIEKMLDAPYAGKTVRDHVFMETLSDIWAGKAAR